MRYFTVSVKITINNTVSFSNEITLSVENFPSRAFIKEKMIEHYENISKTPVKESSGILILNIFEFKDEKDYNDYQNIPTTPIEKEMD